MTEWIFVISGDWAVGADGLQWIPYRRHRKGTNTWTGVSFVRSTRDVLAGCIQERGCDEDTARNLLAGLPDSFDQWKGLQPSPQGLLAR